MCSSESVIQSGGTAGCLASVLVSTAREVGFAEFMTMEAGSYSGRDLITTARSAMRLRWQHSAPVARCTPWVLLWVLTVATSLLGCEGRSEAEVPAQPVAYSHQVHIESGLECQRCHAGAIDSRRAGLPPLATCVSCHRRVIPDHPEVKKLLDAWAAETPILWTKVNVLPVKAMVQFHHGAHTLAGVECAECHGDLASMTVAEPVVDVARMGWCLDCHRQRGASDDCMTCHY